MAPLDDDLTFSVLALLRDRSLVAEDGWLVCSAIAQSVSLSVEVISDELDLLEHRSRVEVTRTAGSVSARITSTGRAWLAARNKAQRQAVTPNPSAQASKFIHDVFMSHASEDCASFVDRLVDELNLVGIKVWYDRETMTAGDVAVSKMNDGIRSSRCAVIIASDSYFSKTFTKVEASTLLYLEMHDPERRIVPVLYGITRADLSEYNPILGTRTYIDSAEKSLAEIVTYIAHAVTLDPMEELEPGFRPITLDPSPFIPGGHNAPYDVLPEPRHVYATRPDLKISWYTPGIVDGHPAIMWDIENAGQGRANDIAVFMPGLKVYQLDKLDAGERHSVKLRFDDRYAYFEFMKPPFQAIAEARDVYNNLYRQYAAASQFPKWGGHDAQFVTTDLGYPYPVSQRIIEKDDGDRYYRTSRMDWGFPS
jgi:hypothetical protein